MEKDKPPFLWVLPPRNLLITNFLTRAISGFIGFDIPSRKAVIFGDGEGSWSTTTLPSIGLAVKNSLLVPEKTSNRYIFISSFTLKQNDLLKTLEKLTGSKFDVEYVDAEAQKATAIEQLSKGDFSGAIALIRYISTVQGYGGNYALNKPTDNELLSLPKEDFEEALTKIVNK
jgi:hypothetical protein